VTDHVTKEEGISRKGYGGVGGAKKMKKIPITVHTGESKKGVRGDLSYMGFQGGEQNPGAGVKTGLERTSWDPKIVAL